MEILEKETDILIIGGGAAGCFAAVMAKQNKPDLNITVLEKAHIERSGCLAAGINAINAYLNPGETPETYLEYVKNDCNGLVRDDLVYSIGKGLNRVTEIVEKWGLPIKKDKDGNYLARGPRSIKINGEQFKPLLAKKVRESGIEVLNRTVATNYIVNQGKVSGAFAFNVRKGIFYVIKARAVICATGGAAGIYRPNNTGDARHKMWYSPFNTGTGYAMGIRAGAEMTTFEMRFVALRVKDVIAPTGSFAFAGAKQLNDKGEEYLKKYDNINTPIRLYATVQEEKAGNGPCYLDLSNISKEEGEKLKESLLGMCPGLVLQWEEQGLDPEQIRVEIEGTEPYIVGGHCQSGYWIDTERRTSLPGLFAAGDVAGGAPKKYVTGAFVEGETAVKNAIKYLEENPDIDELPAELIDSEFRRVTRPLVLEDGYTHQEMEERLQDIMEKYAGGKSNYYELEEKKLLKAREQLELLKKDLELLKADTFHQLMLVHEVIDRVDVARILVEHLLYREETRWPGYQTRIDYPLRNEKWLKFINSYSDPETGKIQVLEREHIPLNDLNNIERGRLK
ncbi:MAG: adenylyl-sulfate reductase subunit alpha [Firmicutes bacterium]|nr:adenylyl-sulfate reductase subunit alpha [Bacillota bacterium]